MRDPTALGGAALELRTARDRFENNFNPGFDATSVLRPKSLTYI